VKKLKELGVAGTATIKKESEQDFFIQWHLTERCNLRCRHCYQDGKRSGELSRVEIREVAREVSELLEDWAETYGLRFSPSFTITGGEPFVRRDFFDIVGELEGRGFGLYLLSNGTLINRRRAEQLREHNFLGVQVSIEGPEPVHDTLRGKGNFRRAIRGAEQVIAAGIPVTLNVTLSRVNSSSIADLAALASKMGARLGFSRLVPRGRGETLMDEMLEAGEVKEIYEKLFSMEENGTQIGTGDPLAVQLKQKPPEGSYAVPSGGCAAGVSGLTFLADGTVTPCRRLPLPIGNLKKDSLREIWSLSPVLTALRQKDAYKGRCGRCSRWAACRGCRAIAYAWSQARGGNDYLMDDPQCFIEEQ
jgi:AdoMet-dependent heme synthase